MIPKALKNFMIELRDATADRKITWSEGAAPNSYYCNRKSYNLHLNYAFDEDAGIASYFFQIGKGGKGSAFRVTSEEDEFTFMDNFSATVSVNANKFDDISDDFFD